MTYLEYRESAERVAAYVVELIHERDEARHERDDAQMGLDGQHKEIVSLSVDRDNYRVALDITRDTLEKTRAANDAQANRIKYLESLYGVAIEQLTDGRRERDELVSQLTDAHRLLKTESATADASSLELQALRAANMALEERIDRMRAAHEFDLKEATGRYHAGIVHEQRVAVASANEYQAELDQSRADRDLLQTMLDDARRARNDAERLAKGYADRWIDSIIGE